MIETPVLIRGGRRFIDEETVMALLSDLDPTAAIALERFVQRWMWEKVVPILPVECANDF